MIYKNDKKDCNDGLIDGVVFCEVEERKLRHGNEQKPKSKLLEIFNFPNLN